MTFIFYLTLGNMELNTLIKCYLKILRINEEEWHFITSKIKYIGATETVEVQV